MQCSLLYNTCANDDLPVWMAPCLAVLMEAVPEALFLLNVPKFCSGKSPCCGASSHNHPGEERVLEALLP